MYKNYNSVSSCQFHASSHMVNQLLTFSQNLLNISSNLYTNSQMRVPLVNCLESSLSYSALRHRTRDSVRFLEKATPQFISRLYRPDISPVDYSIWGIAQQHIYQCSVFNMSVRHLVRKRVSLTSQLSSTSLFVINRENCEQYCITKVITG